MFRSSHTLALLLGVAALGATASPASAQTVYYEAPPTVTYYAPSTPTVTTYRYGLGILPRRRLTVASYPAPVVQSSYYYAPAPVVTPTYYAPAPVVTSSYYYAPAPVVVRRPAVRYYAPPVVVYP